MDVDSPMHGFSCSEALSAAAPTLHLHDLTAAALKALGEEGSQVLVYSGSHFRPMLFNGSNSKVPIGLFVDDSDIFADFDRNCHMLFVQQGKRNRRPDPDLDQPLPSIEQKMKWAREYDEGCAMVAVFVEWKLSTPVFPVLPLVPSLHNDLPWFYMADPGTSQGNHLFGNIAARQSFLIANSGLQSSNRLLYSKDG